MNFALRSRSGGPLARSRNWYLEAGREYVRRYGASELTASAFNPAAAKRNGRPDLVERYYAAREDGTIWPSLNAIKLNFDGSFNEYRRALGLPKNKVGGLKRRRPGEAEPILHVRERRVVEGGASTIWLKRQLDKAERRAERLAEQLDAEKSKPQPEPKLVDLATPKETELRRRLADEKHRRKEVQRELHNAIRRESRARASANRSLNRRTDDSALKEVDRLTDRLAEAEDRLRDRKPTSTPKTVTKTVTRTVKVQDELLLRKVARTEEQVTELRSALSRSELALDEAKDRLAVIRQSALTEAAASQRVRSAERRVAELETQLIKQTEILVGEHRLLRSDEVDALRNTGPAGRAVFAAMIKRVAHAEGKGATKTALWDVIAAARNWIDRLG